jgi:hypothetical protein
MATSEGSRYIKIGIAFGMTSRHAERYSNIWSELPENVRQSLGSFSSHGLLVSSSYEN